MKNLLAGLTLMAAIILPSVGHVTETAEPHIHQMQLGQLDVWIIAATWRDQPAEVLLPTNQEEKDAITRIYPEGKMRNALNVMLVRGKDMLVLVDTGLPNTLPGLMSGLASARVTPEDITHVIITHAHGDHVGGLTAEGKAVFPKAKVIFSEKELDFWINPAHIDKVPQRAKGIFEQLPAALAPYGGRVEKVTVEAPILPGLRMLEAYGHTPGHVGILVESGGKALLFWGDLMHGMPVQMAHPNVSTSYDIDPVEATAARNKMLNRAAEGRWLISGVHVPGVAPWPMPTLK